MGLREAYVPDLAKIKLMLSDPTINRDNYVDRIYEASGVQHAELGRSKAVKPKLYRWAASFIGRSKGLTYNQVAKDLGARDHTAVLSGIKHLNQYLERYSKDIRAHLQDPANFSGQTLSLGRWGVIKDGEETPTGYAVDKEGRIASFSEEETLDWLAQTPRFEFYNNRRTVLQIDQRLYVFRPLTGAEQTNLLRDLERRIISCEAKYHVEKSRK